MIKRPLTAAGAVLVLVLCLLDWAGVPGFGTPPDQKKIGKYVESGMPVEITGEICLRAEKENSYQYEIKNAFLTSLYHDEAKRFHAASENQKSQNQKISLSEKILVTTEKEKNQDEDGALFFAVGSEIRVSGCLEAIEPPGNPGQFDSISYYGARGISYSIWAEKIQVLKEDAGWGEFAQRLKEKMKEHLKKSLPKRPAGVLLAMVLGEKSTLDWETKVNFEVGSLLHVISISGLHLMFLGMGFYGILQSVRLPAAASAVGAGILMALYCWFTGNQPATLRAFLMFCVLMGAKVTGRSYDGLSAMSLSLILMLLQNHRYLFYSGFQLSFAAVLGAGVVYPLFKKRVTEENGTKETRIKTIRQKAGRLLWDNVLTTGVITAVTLPLTCFYFYQIPLLGLLANLLILPTVKLVMYSGTAGILAGMFSITAGKYLLLPARILLLGYEWTLEQFRKVRGAVYTCGQPALWRVVLYYLLLGAVCWIIKREIYKRREQRQIKEENIRQKDRKRVWGRCAGGWCVTGTILTAAAIILLWHGPAPLSVTALDVGQGDSVVVRYQNFCWLIDGGSSSESEVGKYRIVPYLKSQGIGMLDGIIVTHPDEDHINGILEMLEMIAEKRIFLSVRQLFLPIWMKGGEQEKQFLQLAQKAGTKVSYLQKGDDIHVGKLFMEVLHPDGSDYQPSPNSGSVTLGIHYETFDGLLTGDLEGIGEEKVTEYLTEYEYLKVAHHGSKNSTSQKFLEKAMPGVAVISCGKKNRYGHPHQETLDRLTGVETEILLTPGCGAVTAEIKEGILRMWTFKKCIP